MTRASHLGATRIVKQEKLGTVLSHDTTFELIDHLARLQAAVAGRMAEEHEEWPMI